MAETSIGSYEGTYRRSAMALPSLVGLIVLLLLGIWLVTRNLKGAASETAILALAGVFVLLLLLITITAFRVNRWSIERGGIRISDRPRVPMFGLHLRRFVLFEHIRALRWLESNTDHMLEIETAQGRRHRLVQHIRGDTEGGTTLQGFVDKLRVAARQAGHELPAPSPGLSWWNRGAGIGFVAVLVVLSCIIAGGAAWAMWQGTTAQADRQTSKAFGLALLLPIGSFYLLIKMIRRRRAVLASMTRQPQG